MKNAGQATVEINNIIWKIYNEQFIGNAPNTAISVFSDLSFWFISNFIFCCFCVAQTRNICVCISILEIVNQNRWECSHFIHIAILICLRPFVGYLSMKLWWYCDTWIFDMFPTLRRNNPDVRQIEEICLVYSAKSPFKGTRNQKILINVDYFNFHCEGSLVVISVSVIFFLFLPHRIVHTDMFLFRFWICIWHRPQVERYVNDHYYVYFLFLILFTSSSHTHIVCLYSIREYNIIKKKINGSCLKNCYWKSAILAAC